MSAKNFIVFSLLALFVSCARPDAAKLTEEAKADFTSGKFGLFIHFGIFSVSSGVWGTDTLPIGQPAEHIMRVYQIPRNDYRKLASEFNPVHFNPREVVDLAKEAGMKYIVITAKHHDGFAMFDSDYDDYNIKDGTPYGKDLLKELSDECRKQGMPLGFYYSHTRDWDEFNSVCIHGNHWDWSRDDTTRNQQMYLDSKVKTQLNELLTNYGDVYCLWFDTPYTITEEQAADLYSFVKERQAKCLINSRLGQGLGDYGVMGDNQIPPGVLKGVWECPATMNHSWGFHKTDTTWKSSVHMITQLVDLSSKNINYLLNIGPKSDGSIPEESVERLKEIGAWMKKNGKAINNSGPSPWFQEMDGLRITSSANQLFVTILNTGMDSITLYNIQNEITAAEIVGENKAVEFRSGWIENPKLPFLKLYIPEEFAKDTLPVIQLTFTDELKVQDQVTQMTTGDILLTCGKASVSRNGGKLEIAGMDGVLDTNNWPYFSTRYWTHDSDYLEWTFNLIEPGTFEVNVVNVATSRDLNSYLRKWNSIYTEPASLNRVIFSVDATEVPCVITGTDPVKSIRSVYRPELLNPAGTIEITEAGTYKAKLKAEYINPNDPEGLVIYEVRLQKK